MKIDQEWIEDILKLGSDAVEHLFKGKQGTKSSLRSHSEIFIRHLNLVNREEFDAAFAMLSRLRTKQEEILNRLEILEKKIGLPASRKKSTEKPSPLPKKKKQKKEPKKNLLSVKHSNRERKQN